VKSCTVGGGLCVRSAPLIDQGSVAVGSAMRQKVRNRDAFSIEIE
jgi:hypothetical protein